MTLTGAQIRGLLEQQEPRKLLQVSNGFTYRWDAGQAAGQRVVPGSVTLQGAPLVDSRNYRVVLNNFLAEGGDGFAMFKSGADRHDSGIRDGDALRDYLAKAAQAGHPAGSALPGNRIQAK